MDQCSCLVLVPSRSWPSQVASQVGRVASWGRGRRQGSDLRCPLVTSLVPAHPSCTREGTLRQRHVCLVCGVFFFFQGKV